MLKFSSIYRHVWDLLLWIFFFLFKSQPLLLIFLFLPDVNYIRDLPLHPPPSPYLFARVFHAMLWKDMHKQNEGTYLVIKKKEIKA